jgi:hypothetical protein
MLHLIIHSLHLEAAVLELLQPRNRLLKPHHRHPTHRKAQLQTLRRYRILGHLHRLEPHSLLLQPQLAELELLLQLLLIQARRPQLRIHLLLCLVALHRLRAQQAAATQLEDHKPLHRILLLQ